MKGIILKDIYEMIHIKKNRNNLLFHYFLILLSLIFFKNGFGFVVSSLILILMSVSLILQATVELDEKYNFDKIQLTFPVTKKEIVLSKYFLGLAFCAVNMIFLFLIMLVYALLYQTFPLILGIQFVLLSIIISLALLALYHYSCITFGTKGGLLLFASIMLSIVGGYVLTKMNVDWQVVFVSVMSLNPTIVLSTGMILSIVLLLISYVASVKSYIRKHS
ncbi:hypothetical protein QW71_02945 [Paenibacillus sp. IHB B 3415]|uniref:ABC-2 transporter permease n=1 Tax=Paenibacillus sp. IHB B 3415 TaxID=867080 RepID=UPI000573F605|nr:ABC-2 transporter permease [Paenibacillus sp. IHB B 3415]KHL97131.1 hypothetical protein QW71_02945 [Paenibacillus sp. IHB B 3415]